MSILLPRLVHAWNVFPKAKEALPESPATTAKRFYYDELVFDPSAVRFVMQTFGETQILIGTDYPFPLGEQEPGSGIDALELPEADQERLFHKTALEWLGLAKSRFQ